MHVCTCAMFLKEREVYHRLFHVQNIAWFDSTGNTYRCGINLYD